MPDQAQGLRALADRARRDQFGSSFDSDPALPAASDGVDPTLRADSPAIHHAALAEAVVSVSSPPCHDKALRKEDAGPPYPHHPSYICHTAARPVQRHARVIAVTSGKGGVGKTNFSTNLGLAFAAQGQRVILVDADLGLANLHLLMGLSPRYNLEHILRGERSIQETLCPGPNGIQILCGASGIASLADLDADQRSYFIANLQELDTLSDIVIIDTGAGLSRNVIAILAAVEEVIIVTTPEPTAITDAYATIKVLSQENQHTRMMLVLNMAQNETEARLVAQRLNSISQRFLNRSLDYLGYVLHDAVVPQSVRAQQPFLLAAPYSRASQCIRQIAVQLSQHVEQPSQKGGIGGLLGRIQHYFGYNQSGARASR